MLSTTKKCNSSIMFCWTDQIFVSWDSPVTCACTISPWKGFYHKPFRGTWVGEVQPSRCEQGEVFWCKGRRSKENTETVGEAADQKPIRNHTKLYFYQFSKGPCLSDVQIIWFDTHWESTFQDSNPIPKKWGLKVKFVQALEGQVHTKMKNACPCFWPCFWYLCFLKRTG